MKSRKASRFIKQDGVVIELLLFLLPVLLILTALVINTANMAARKTRIQAAGDAAAHAGTVMLNSSEGGYDQALSTAIETLKAHRTVLDGLGGIEFDDALDPNQRHWEQNGWSITIRRGQVRSGVADGTFPFISLEQDETPFPGLPGFVLANAVQVDLSYTESRLLFPVYSEGQASLSGVTIANQSLASVDQEKKACVAPFAIPLCSLINADGEFNRDAVCWSDRVFTAADPGKRFRNFIVPDYLYDPDLSTKVDAGSCFWDSPQYSATDFNSQPDDNWGVVGLPSAFEMQTEAQIAFKLRQPQDNCYPASIGEEFKIFASGFQSKDTNDALWDQIRHLNKWTSGKHPKFESLTLPGGAFWKLSPNWLPFAEPEKSSPNCAQAPSFTPKDQIVCGSERLDWKGCPDSPTGKEDPRSYGDPDGKDATVWQIEVPIIADTEPDAPACPHGYGVNSTIDIRRKYTIVGFARVNIYDVDIGKSPPRAADYSHLSLTNFGLPGGALGSDWNASASTAWPICSNAGPHPHLQDPSWKNFRNLPYTEAGQAYDPTPCNVVRARIDCDTIFTAGTIASERPKVRIIR